jgi:hypothetical protein
LRLNKPFAALLALVPLDLVAAFTGSILQLSHVMQISFEIGTAGAHNGVEDSCGFGVYGSRALAETPISVGAFELDAVYTCILYLTVYVIKHKKQLAETFPLKYHLSMTDTQKAARMLGRLGGLKGGKARAKALTPERRREIAQKAIAARWAKPRES